MVFSSPVFLFLFLPLVLLLYFLVRGGTYKNLVLLLFSLIFYFWGETYLVLLMLLSITLNFVFGNIISKQSDKINRKRILLLGIALNLLILIIFKYSNFIVDNLNLLLIQINVSTIDIKSIHLPIGISFFTFQSMSYIIDVYRGSSEVSKRFSNVALYISLFPQLIAGPIVRYHNIAGQLQSRQVAATDFVAGSKRFIIGLSKKVLIANTVARVADHIFELPAGEHTVAVAWLGAIAYTLQIYFDFSGYSDMAIGLGRMFGFAFPENFNYPYISKSIKEFWRRWHISLSTWFRDYLYIPLGGNRKGAKRTYYNLVIVFFVTGLWHGASWTFVFWGLFHGFFLIIERIGFEKLLIRSGNFISTIYTLLVVIIGWVFFRADNFSYAYEFTKAMFGVDTPISPKFYLAYYLNPEIVITFLSGIVLSTPLYFWLRKIKRKVSTAATGTNVANYSALAVYIILLLLCILYIASDTYNPFIYFRF